LLSSSAADGTYEEANEDEEIILSDNEGHRAQHRQKKFESEDRVSPLKERKLKPASIGSKVKEEDRIQPPAPKRLLINVKVPARVERPERVIQLLGGQEHLVKVTITSYF